MIISKVAKRYATALFLEAKNRKELENVAADMQRINETILGSRELQIFLKSHIISRQNKKSTLDELFSKDISELSRQFISLILEKRREDQLSGICGYFGVLFNKEQGLLEIEVFVVKKPDAGLEKQLKKALESRTGSKVNLSYIEDHSLKGGMAVRINDTVIDGTIKHKLQQLELTLQQAGM
ncbi:ATP synthase F1 subunit delta [Natronogracilivirga saccharolytica]|uniref:ATP synthase subunit delta n=1 Tax=Natronogracilivirga saccharolytica TaxID=2812953 RepID=A0A8J7RSX8_9BACT|nr:ATP synthase F1 subunit delta [Natronogracilivirga saccharolytica]MBP3192372.1 ATP synthase F1 subunit delta [Natronogracilivirga saccharolytica]